MSSEPAVKPSLPANVVQQWVDNQAKELEFRAQELTLRKQEDQNQFELAQKALAAQKEDRSDQRSFHLRSRKHSYYFSIGILFLVLGFLGLLVWMDKDALAGELIKAVVYLGGGAIGGYFYGRTKGMSKVEDGFTND